MAECVKGGERSIGKEVGEMSEAAKTILLDIGFVTIVVGIAILGSGGITFDADLFISMPTITFDAELLISMPTITFDAEITHL